MQHTTAPEQAAAYACYILYSIFYKHPNYMLISKLRKIQ